MELWRWGGGVWGGGVGRTNNETVSTDVRSDSDGAGDGSRPPPDAEGGMMCWRVVVEEGCVGVLLAHLGFTHPIWGQRQEAEPTRSETLGERLALTDQQRRGIAAAPPAPPQVPL